MKKILCAMLVSVLVLTGCGSAKTLKGEYTYDHDGAQETAVIEFVKDGDDITEVTNIDVLGDEFPDGKVAYSESGEYGMAATTGGNTWAQQIQMLADYIVENDKFPTLDEEGHDVDGVTGASIKFNEFEQAFNAAK